jgi:hypothetical protein
VRPPTSTSQPTPGSVPGLKQCNKYGSWLNRDTKFAKETFLLHVSRREEVVCNQEGCGDVVGKNHFFKDHQDICKKRAVGERKKLSFTDAAKLAPKRQDTIDIFTADGRASKSAKRAPVGPTGDGVTFDCPYGMEEELQPEGRRRGVLQGTSIWAGS